MIRGGKRTALMVGDDGNEPHVFPSMAQERQTAMASSEWNGLVSVLL